MHGIDYFCSIYKVDNESLKIKDLAKMLDCKQPQINAWKKGERNIPKHHLESLCDIFSVPEDKSYLFNRPALSEVDRYEIEIFLTKAKLKNMEPGEDEEINESVRETFEFQIALYERNLEAIKLISELKPAIMKYSHIPDKFYENLKKVEKLVEDLK